MGRSTTVSASRPVKRIAPKSLWAGSRRVSTSLLQTAIVLATTAAVWQIYVLTFRPSILALPSPIQVATALIELVETGFNGIPLTMHVGISLFRVTAGFLASLAIGIPVGLAMGSSAVTRRVATPLIVLFRPIPPFAWLALLVLWFGIGELPKVILIWTGCFTIMALSTMDGVLRVPPQLGDAARCLGANRRQVFLRVVIPSSLPQILDGARVALATAWGFLIAAELVAAEAGIGNVIITSKAFLRGDQTLAAILVLGFFGVLTDLIVVAVQKRTTGWARQ